MSFGCLMMHKPIFLVLAFTVEGEFKVTGAMKNYYDESGYFVVRYMFNVKSKIYT